MKPIQLLLASVVLALMSAFAQDSYTPMNSIRIYGTDIDTPALYQVQGSSCDALANAYWSYVENAVSAEGGVYYCFFADVVDYDEQNSYYETFSSAVADAGFGLVQVTDYDNAYLEQWDAPSGQESVDMLFEFRDDGVYIFVALSN